MKAFLKNYRQSPRKVRLVAELIKGKRVAEAFVYLNSMPKRAAGPIENLLASAVANAKNSGVDVESLWVENVTVNKGIVMKRSMPRARGSASRINKRTSHIMITLKDSSVDKSEKKSEAKKIVKKEVKKPVSKAKKSKSVKKEVKA